MTLSPLLELREIDTFYGDIQVHDQVNLCVHAAEVVSLLGGNASGKSTLMKVILGLIKPTSGRVFFDGQEITALPTAQIVRLGIASVPEARRIFPAMSVRENLRMGAYMRRDKRGIEQDYEKILSMFPMLKERLQQTGGTLSGGEQQMLAFGRALMSRPRLICMDEPTMGLSPDYTHRVLEWIGVIRHESTAVLLIEQNARLALQIAQRAYVLQSGRIVLCGDADDLRQNPQVEQAYLGGAE